MAKGLIQVLVDTEELMSHSLIFPGPIDDVASEAAAIKMASSRSGQKVGEEIMQPGAYLVVIEVPITKRTIDEETFEAVTYREMIAKLLPVTIGTPVGGQ